MTKHLGFLVVVCHLVLPTAAHADEKESFRCSEEVFQAHEGVIALSGPWKYHPGDNPDWADPDLDDSSWVTTGSHFTADNQPPGGWSGIGWYRIHLTVDPELRDRPFSLIVVQWGASEFYLDGERIHTLGRVARSPEEEVIYLAAETPTVLPIRFDQSPEHVLAVRFSYNRRIDFFGYPHQRIGVDIRLGEPTTAHTIVANELRRETQSRTFFGTAALTFALLHLLLFAFYPKLKGHLYYAVFTFSAAVIAFVPLRFRLTTDIDQIEVLFRVFELSIIAVTIFGLRFLYAVFYHRLPRIFWAWLGAGVVVGLLSWNGPMNRVFIYTLVVFAEILRVLVLAVVRKKAAAWLIALGTAAFILSSAYQILMGLEILPHTTDNAYLYGLFAMLIMMSISLARFHARINKDLRRQIVQVKDLSAQALENERRYQEQVKKRMRLEADNALKEIELEEARKRQKVLEQLEEANRELRQTQAQLVHSEKMAALGTLVAGVAHEINTPVGAISSMHNTLVRALDKLKSTIGRSGSKETDANRELQNALKVIDEANEVISSGAARVADIVKKLRSFARLDEAELKRADIHEGIEDTLALAHHELKHHVDVKKSFGKIPPIACYPGQLNQVFINILVNASQAIEGRGEITITTSCDDEKVYVEFKDTGKGIPEDQLEKIFDPGFTTKGVGVGTGLGLSICYQIIQAHKGAIEVESEVNRGTTFRIILPKNLDKLIETRESASSAGPHTPA